MLQRSAGSALRSASIVAAAGSTTAIWRPVNAAQWSSTAGDQEPPHKRALLSKMLYRSKQRGWLELDLLMGMWAERVLPTMTDQGLKAYEVVLDQENPPLFKWLTGQEDPPEYLKTNEAFQALRSHVREQYDGRLLPAAAAAPGKDWVKGWNDSGKPSSATS